MIRSIAILFVSLCAATAAFADTWQEARDALAAGDLVRARTLFTQVVEDHPGHAPAHEMLGLTAFRQGDVDDALDSLGTALGLQPENTDTRIRLASIAADDDRWGLAMETVTAVQSSSWDNLMAEKAAEILVPAAQHLNRMPVAAEWLRERIAVQPASPTLLSGLGTILEAMGDNAAAFDAYAAGFDLAPSNLEPARKALWCAFKADGAVAGGWDAVATLASTVAQASGGVDDAHRAARVHVRRHAYADALDWIDRGLARDAKHTALLALRGRCLLCMARWDEAATALKMAVDSGPEDDADVRRAHRDLARLAERDLEFAEAARHHTAGGNEERAAAFRTLADDVRSATDQRRTIQARIDELVAFQAELTEIGDVQGAEQLTDEIEFERERASAIDANLEEIRRGLSGRGIACS
jgi:tetratricopeptide (TPR) repeat protein